MRISSARRFLERGLISLFTMVTALGCQALANSKGVYSVAFSPDGAGVLTGGADKTAKLWDAGTGKLLNTFKGHSQYVVSVAFSPDGTRVLTSSHDGTAKLWDAGTGKVLRTFKG